MEVPSKAKATFDAFLKEWKVKEAEVNRREREASSHFSEILFKDAKPLKDDKRLRLSADLEDVEKSFIDFLSCRDAGFNLGLESAAKAVALIDAQNSLETIEIFGSVDGAQNARGMMLAYKENCHAHIGETLINRTLAEFTFGIFRTVSEVKSLKRRMKLYSGVMKELHGIISNKRSESQVAESICNDFWSNLKKRGVIV